MFEKFEYVLFRTRLPAQRKVVPVVAAVNSLQHIVTSQNPRERLALNQSLLPSFFQIYRPYVYWEESISAVFYTNIRDMLLIARGKHSSVTPTL